MISRKLIVKAAGTKGRRDNNIEGRAKIRKTADFYQSQSTVKGYLQSIKTKVSTKNSINYKHLFQI